VTVPEDIQTLWDGLGCCLALHGFKENCPACVGRKACDDALDRLASELQRLQDAAKESKTLRDEVRRLASGSEIPREPGESWWDGAKRRARDLPDGYTELPTSDWKGIVWSWESAESRLQAAEHALREVLSVLEDDKDWDLARNFARISEIVIAALTAATAPTEGVNEPGDLGESRHPSTAVGLRSDTPRPGSLTSGGETAE
jgi:hypothetical protein